MTGPTTAPQVEVTQVGPELGKEIVATIESFMNNRTTLKLHKITSEATRQNLQGGVEITITTRLEVRP